MPWNGDTCAVRGCWNSRGKLKKWKKSACMIHVPEKHADCPCLTPFSFHQFPRKDECLQKQWIAAINRKGFEPSKFDRVCSIHFVDQRPTLQNPVPSLLLGYQGKVVKGRRVIKKFPLKENSSKKRKNDLGQQVDDSTVGNTLEMDEDLEHEQQPPLESAPLEVPQTSTVCAASQSDLFCCPTITKSFIDHVEYCRSTSPTVEKKSVLSQTNATIEYASLSKASVLFYTGLDKTVADNLIKIFTPMQICITCKLMVEEQFLLVMMRLRLGLVLEDLAYQFSLSPTIVSRLFKQWISTMCIVLEKHVCWLPKKQIQATLPSQFKEMYPKTTCVIDCIELILQKSRHPRFRSKMYRTYKSYNSVKFLVVMAPSGYIMYVSPLYGGRASNKHIVIDSGFLHMLTPGDEVMAAQGFKIELELAMLGAKLNNPSFIAGKNQLSEEEVTRTKSIAACRIHVQRSIRRMKKYCLINSILSISSLKQLHEIVTVVSALVNLKLPLVLEK